MTTHVVKAPGKMLLPILLFIFHANFSSAQNHRSLVPADTAEISTAARATLDHFKTLLGILCDTTITQSDKDKAIENSYVAPQQIFYNNQMRIETDLDANVKQGGNHDDLYMDIDNYLKNFRLTFHPSPSDSGVVIEGQDAVDFSIDDISRVKEKDDNLFLRIRYNEIFRGKDQSGTKYLKNERIATFIVGKQGNVDWRVCLSQVSFDKEFNDNELNVPVAAGASGILYPTANGHKDYSKLMQKGMDANKFNNFIEAYRYYTESKENRSMRTVADEKIEDLKTSMHTSGISNPNEVWFNGLKQKGDELEQKHKYEEARRYYDYAHGLHLADNDLQRKINSLDTKITAMNTLEETYNKAAYDVAIAGYNDAITKDPENSDLYVGLAKCYAATDKGSDAVYNFSKALTLDSTNANAYAEFAEYFHSKKNYNTAYNYYLSFVKYTDYQSQEVLDKLKDYKTDDEKSALKIELESANEKGSVLTATNISMEALKHKGSKDKRKKPRKANVLRVHFDIEKNLVAQSGMKDVYIVITDPMGKVIKDPNNSNAVTINTGEEVIYSVLDKIVFTQNESSKNNTIDYSWNRTKTHKKGKYKISVYGLSVSNVYKIGENTVKI